MVSASIDFLNETFELSNVLLYRSSFQILLMILFMAFSTLGAHRKKEEINT